MSRVHTVEVGLGLSNAAMFAVVDVSVTETFRHVWQTREVLDGSEEESVPLKRGMAVEIVRNVRMPNVGIVCCRDRSGLRVEKVKKVHTREHVGEHVRLTWDVFDLKDESLEE